MARKSKPIVSDYWRRRLEPPAAEEPSLQLVEVCWQVRSMTDGKTLTCSIFRSARGVEVRALYSAGDIAHSKPFGDIQIARDYARTLHEIVISKGGFKPLPPGAA
jgi:hypothetical protein